MTEISIIVEEEMHEYLSVKEQQEILDAFEDYLRKRNYEIYDSVMQAWDE